MSLTYILIGAAVVAVVFVLLALVGSRKSAHASHSSQPTHPPAQRLPRADPSHTTPATAPTRTPQAHSQTVQSVPVEVRQTPVQSLEDAKFEELVKLSNYDRDRAERHIARLERNYPDKSRLWCIEKAIEDGLRDRHAR